MINKADNRHLSELHKENLVGKFAIVAGFFALNLECHYSSVRM